MSLLDEFNSSKNGLFSSKNRSFRYQYSDVDLSYVLENPEEYIIPACLPACQRFWDKNIETFMVSNYEDDHYYVLVKDLSEENMQIFHDLMAVDPRYFYDYFRNCYGVRTFGKSGKDRNILPILCSCFQLQDVREIRYQTSSEFLDSYQRHGGNYVIDPISFRFSQSINPDLAHVCFDDALEAEGKRSLYISEEDRVYQNAVFYEWHQRYVQNQKKSDHKVKEKILY